MTEVRKEWQPIKTAPYQIIIWVRNPVMDSPVKATRGYADQHGVHPNTTYCTSVYTPDYGELGLPSGKLVCPTEWKPIVGNE